ncbi:MAG: phosphoadenosine phosphosulfate reductase family protein [Cloacibacillus porcorum]|uniref:phosphoadenosine phosphosulfate reductase domain-containing protein n=1 Tax=Cloacibacillus porcorum TaxID=1197717 RepID=UPI0023F34277|nr:phosphoadenosine phosphosulfate reductase family protein [Cloacibacillus porcorum]MCD7875736.1 phosphoadenosine phosphosulfate reductase family protein [Cloacibacillus porcorum]
MAKQRVKGEGGKIYLQQNVLEAAQERISAVFDEFENIVVSVSGGKDSTVLLNLALAEARRRDRRLRVFFLDQEAEYQATIDIIDHYMNLPEVEPWWIQLPMEMFNATSYVESFLTAWEPGQKWMREKSPLAVDELDAEYPHRFYQFISWFQAVMAADNESTCFLIGLRAEESLNRFRTVIKNPGYKDWKWTTAGGGVVKAYPLYDWTFEDVWIYIVKNNVMYNRIYDFLYGCGFHIQEMRVSNLIHSHSFQCLPLLQKFEPETYNRLVERLKGVHVAARYASEPAIYSNRAIPDAFKSWKEYRDFLLETIPSEHVEQFKRRFERQGDSEYVCRQQCRQLLQNDFEGALAVTKEHDTDPLKKWREIL